MADWGGLPGGVVALFAKRLQLIEDFIAFRSTCSSWRKATSLFDFDKSCPRLPLLLLHKYAYDIDKKRSDLICRSPREDMVDCHDENIQIHDDGGDDDENEEMVADEVNYESDEGADEIDESDKETKENSESEEEKFENDVNQDNSEKVERGKDSEIEEDNSDTDESHKMDESNNDENYEIEEDNSDTDESTEMDENSDSDEMVEDNSDANENTKMDENSVVTHKSMLSTEIGENSVVNHECMFFSLSKGKGCMISLPEARGMECIGSKGWLIMVNRSTGDMCLFHPLTRARILLPNAPSEVQLYILPKHLRCAVLSASPSETSDYVVMVAYAEPKYISGSCVVFWKPGNLTWTRVETLPPCVENLTYYNGKFYALTLVSEVWMCDISGPNPQNNAIKIIELPWKWSRQCAQLVECGGRLLVVAPFFCYSFGMESYHDLKMVELDVIKGSYSTITSLGSWTVFLGRNEGFSVDANQFPPGIIEPNRIYFSDRSYRIASRGRDNVPRPDLGLASWGVWINF